jgi:hypothetical protein
LSGATVKSSAPASIVAAVHSVFSRPASTRHAPKSRPLDPEANLTEWSLCDRGWKSADLAIKAMLFKYIDVRWIRQINITDRNMI